MAVKKVLMSKKIANTLYDIYPKTSADIVEYGNNSNVKAALDSIATDLSDIYTKSQVEALVGAVDQKLTTLIGEGEIDTAFDTIKEIADWLVSGDGSAVSGLISDVSTLKTTVGNASSGLVKDVDDLQTAVGDSNSGLVKDMADAQSDIGALETAVGDANSGLVKQVADLETAVGDSNSGLVKDMADAQSDITALETAVGDSNSGLVKDVADAQSDITALETAVGDSSSGLVKQVADLETTVGDSTSGLVKDVADLQAAGATKVEASTTNGYIKINGTDTKVYDDSAIPAANIVESTTKQFVAATDVTNWNSAAHILSSSTGATDNDLIITEIVEQQGGGE